MQHITKELTIEQYQDQFIAKELNYDAVYQRDKAWSKKLQQELILSIINDSFIPPILIADNTVIDGKQRTLAILHYLDGEYDIPYNDKYYFFSGLTEDLKSKILNYRLLLILITADKQEIEKLFIKLNTSSIKLNEAERMNAEATPKIRDAINNFIKNNKIIQQLESITDKRIHDKRYSTKKLVAWLATAVYIWKNKRDAHTSMRNKLKSLIKSTSDEIINILNEESFINTFNFINLLFGNANDFESLMVKGFITTFTSVFLAIYMDIDFYRQFENITEKFKHNNIHVNELTAELLKEQIGRGIKSDAFNFNLLRANIVKNKFFECFELDKKRAFTSEQKHELWSKYKKEGHINSNDKCECPSCHRFYSFNEMEVDHVIPYSKKGQTNLNNARFLCKACNRTRGDKSE